MTTNVQTENQTRLDPWKPQYHGKPPPQGLQWYGKTLIELPPGNEYIMEDQKSQEELTRRESIVKELIIKQPTQNPGKETVKSNEIQTICFIFCILKCFKSGGKMM